MIKETGNGKCWMKFVEKEIGQEVTASPVGKNLISIRSLDEDGNDVRIIVTLEEAEVLAEELNYVAKRAKVYRTEHSG